MKVMLIGPDRNQILTRRFRAAGCEVMLVSDGQAALDCARHQTFDVAVLLSKGSLLSVAEIVFNLIDVNQTLEVIILVDRPVKPSNRFLRQLLSHPIEKTKILTRRQLRDRLHSLRSPQVQEATH